MPGFATLTPTEKQGGAQTVQEPHDEPETGAAAARAAPRQAARDRTAGDLVNGTICLLTTLTFGISLADPPHAKNGEIEVRQRLNDCEAQIAALTKNAP